MRRSLSSKAGKKDNVHKTEAAIRAHSEHNSKRNGSNYASNRKICSNKKRLDQCEQRVLVIVDGWSDRAPNSAGERRAAKP
mmetsp:Transcript_16736/g.68526  ORF Transcript_16736/g.68526 Transcript_16736/m.68526 type:complete len:81 (+) Transcript_16736:187-429(+)